MAETSYYQVAFQDHYTALWNKTPFNLASDSQSLAFLHSMAIFLNTNPISELDRRTLLIEYFKPFITNDDLINSIQPVLPTENMVVNQVLQTICNLYDTSPIRNYALLSDDQASEFNNELVNSNFDTAMGQAYKSAKLLGEILLRPIYKNEKLTYQIYTPDNYRIKDVETGEEIWLHYPTQVNGEYNDAFQVWTTDTIKIVNSEGLIVKTERNELGRIPFVKLELNKTFDYIKSNTSDYWSVIQAQLNWNRTSTIQTNDSFFSGFPIISLINFGKDIKSTDVGPGKVLILNVIEGDGLNEDSMPSVITEKPEISYDALQAMKIEELRVFLRSMNLPEGMVSGDGSAQSGTALRLERIGLDEYRKTDKASLLSFEKQVLEEVYELTSGVKSINGIGSNIIYADSLSSIPEAPIDELNILTQYLELGLVNKIDIYKKLIDPNTTLSDDEIKAVIYKNENDNKTTILEEVVEEEIEEIEEIPTILEEE